MSKPTKAFILAAGKGTRMRPLTHTTPKPLLKIAGKPLLTHIAEKLEAVGVKDIVVNASHLADQIIEWAESFENLNIQVVVEDELLDTGGGVKNALPYLGDEPFYVIAGKSFWTDPPGEKPILEQIGEAWNPETMDILLGLQDTNTMFLDNGVGDYDIGENDLPQRTPDQTGRYQFTNIRINHPRIFENSPDGAFSFIENMDAAEKAGRLHGFIHENWHHMPAPEQLEQVNKHIQQDE